MTGNRQQKNKVPMIVSAVPVDDHRLSIEFGSGSSLDLNMLHRLQTTRHYGLNDTSVFRAAVTDGSRIIFDPSSVFVPDIFPQEAVIMALRALPFDEMRFMEVQAVGSSRILLKMGTGSVIVLNMKNHIHTHRYRVLQDEELFLSVRADGEALVFGVDYQDICLRIDEGELTHLLLSIPAEGI